MNRYAPQILLSQIGEEGQKALHKAAVAIIGCGALGSTIAEQVARAGVGNILVVDRDFVELDNLHRQYLFTEADVGIPKAVVAEGKLRAINSEITIEGMVDDANQTNIEQIIENKDLILDGTDNLNVRFLMNDACIKNNVPFIYGACVSVNGMTMNILPEGPCLRCLLPQIPAPGSVPSTDTVGIINTLPSVVGSLESTEAIKYLVGNPLDSDLTIIDIWEKEFRTIEVSQREECPCCVHHTYEFLERKAEATALVGRNAVQIAPAKKYDLSLHELAQKLEPQGKVKETLHILFFSVDQYTMSVFPDGRAIIKGTTDEQKAKYLYSKYLD